MIRDDVVDLVIGYGLGVRQIVNRFPAGARDFIFSPKQVDGLCGPPSLLFVGNGDFFPGGKRSACQADHSYLVPRLGICGALGFFSHMPAWGSKGNPTYTIPVT